MFKKVPQYRLQGYTDAWELRRIFEIADRFDNLRIPIASSLRVPGSTPYYGANGIQDYVEGYTHDGEFVLVAEDGANDLKNYPVNLVNGKIWVNNHAHVLQGKENIANNNFLSYSINRANIEVLLVGGGRAKLNSDVLMDIELEIPSLPEQEAIGNFFSTLDSQITLHQRKLDMLKEQKKTYLKLLFPAKGQTKPVLRFQGFEDDWEKVKLGEIGETFTGLSGKTKEDFGHGEGKFITYVNVFNNPISDLLGTDRIEVDESQTNVQFGDIFFTTSSETPEEVGMSSVWLGNGNNIYLNSFCFGFRPTLKLSNHFMAYVLRSTEIRKKFIFLAQGISRYNISKTKVMNISIPLPTLPEQESIGTFFQTLDQEIAQVEDKLASLKEMKKTLLRKLFV